VAVSVVKRASAGTGVRVDRVQIVSVTWSPK
jgi:hypothetical protein